MTSLSFFIIRLNLAIEKITASLVADKGTVEVKMPPKAVSAREETELQAMMDRLAAENAEKDGDDDDEDSDDDKSEPDVAAPDTDASGIKD